MPGWNYTDRLYRTRKEISRQHRRWQGPGQPRRDGRHGVVADGGQGRLMRKVIVGAQVSMDGVMQAPGQPTEDPTDGLTFCGWVMPYADQEFGEEMDHLFHVPFDLLLGRKTYEIFAAYWPYY